MKTIPEYFGSMVFDDRVMRAKLPAKVYASLKHTIDEGAALDPGLANRADLQVHVAGHIAVLIVRHRDSTLHI